MTILPSSEDDGELTALVAVSEHLLDIGGDGVGIREFAGCLLGVNAPSVNADFEDSPRGGDQLE